TPFARSFPAWWTTSNAMPAAATLASAKGTSRFRICAPWLPPTTRILSRRSFARGERDRIPKNSSRTGLPVTIAPGNAAAPRAVPTATRLATWARSRFVRPGIAFCSWMRVGTLRTHRRGHERPRGVPADADDGTRGVPREEAKRIEKGQRERPKAVEAGAPALSHEALRAHELEGKAGLRHERR